MGRVFAILAAVLVHVAVILFGGILFMHDKETKGKVRQVDLLSETANEKEKEKEKKKDQEQPAEKKEQIDPQNEPPPDAAEVVRNLEVSAAAAAPALEAASLSAIEQALNGGGGGGEFGDALSFASGGRIGGTGKAGALEEKVESAFSMAEIDQKPRVVYQATPNYPSELRGKKVEGAATVIFIVDSTGRVTNPRVERSSLPAFDRPAVDAVKQFKFEPAVRGGQRVDCRMRITIRFQPS